MASPEDTSSLYSELPKTIEEDVECFMKEKRVTGARGEGKTRGQIEGFLTQHLPKKRLKEGLLDGLKYRMFFVDNADKSKKRRYDRRRRCRHKLTSKEKRNLGLFQLPKKQTFKSFAPLNQLWKEYMKEVIDVTKVTEVNKASSAQQKLLKADYHGAMVTVTKSKTPSLVGQTGIVVMETKNVFRIVTIDDKLKTIPKENCVFAVEFDGFVFSIQGSQFRYTAAERIHRKFKFTPRLAQDL